MLHNKNSWSDIPYLLDEIARLETEIKKLQNILNLHGFNIVREGEKITLSNTMVKKTLITEKYPQLVDRERCYCIYGNLIILGDLDVQLNKPLYVKGHVKVDGGLEIKTSVEAGNSIDVEHSIAVGGDIKAGADIKVGWSIEAGNSVEAGNSIRAGCGIKAGKKLGGNWSIKAGTSIHAGLDITCTGTISCGSRIFAGLCSWRKPDRDAEKTVTCKRLESGRVEYGILYETSKEDVE